MYMYIILAHLIRRTILATWRLNRLLQLDPPPIAAMPRVHSTSKHILFQYMLKTVVGFSSPLAKHLAPIFVTLEEHYVPKVLAPFQITNQIECLASETQSSLLPTLLQNITARLSDMDRNAVRFQVSHAKHDGLMGSKTKPFTDRLEQCQPIRTG